MAKNRIFCRNCGGEFYDYKKRVYCSRKCTTTSPYFRESIRTKKLGTKLSLETRLKISTRNKGKINSPEHNLAISLAHKGIPLTKEHREKISKSKIGCKPNYSKEALEHRSRSMSGSNNHMWNGGKEDYLKNEAKKRDDYTCQSCGLREPAIMEADHIKPKYSHPELKFELNNLMTLCPNCHKRKTISEVPSCRI